MVLNLPLDECIDNTHTYSNLREKKKNKKKKLQQAIESQRKVLTVYFGEPSMFITLWFAFDYGTNPPLGTLII
jgi:hypothetical protein